MTKKHEDNLEEKIVKEWRYLSKIKIKDENHLLFAGFIIVILSLLVINTIFIVYKNPGLRELPRIVFAESSTAKVLTSLQVAENSASTVYIKDVTSSDAPDPAFPLSENETLLMMNVTIKNNSLAEQHLSPTLQIFVRTRDAGYYPFMMTTKTTNLLPVTDVKPGETVSGDVSFAIPKSIAEPLLYIDLGWENVAPIIYNVTK